MGQNQLENKSTMWIIFGVLQLACCNQITGVLTIVFASIANGDFTKGDTESYLNNIKLAKLFTIIGVTIGVILWLVMIFIYVMVILGMISSELMY